MAIVDNSIQPLFGFGSCWALRSELRGHHGNKHPRPPSGSLEVIQGSKMAPILHHLVIVHTAHCSRQIYGFQNRPLIQSMHTYASQKMRGSFIKALIGALLWLSGGHWGIFRPIARIRCCFSIKSLALWRAMYLALLLLGFQQQQGRNCYFSGQWKRTSLLKSDLQTFYRLNLS